MLQDVSSMWTGWETAFEKHYLSLLRLCVLLCGDRDTAEDLAQDAFVRAARHLDEIDETRVWPYLRKAAINLWKNRLRGLAAERRTQERFRQRGSLRAGDPPPAEDVDVLWREVLSLPSRQRACLVLRYYEGLSESEIAKALRISTGTVKSHTARALHRLRKELEHVD